MILFMFMLQTQAVVKQRKKSHNEPKNQLRFKENEYN